MAPGAHPQTRRTNFVGSRSHHRPSGWADDWMRRHVGAPRGPRLRRTRLFLAGHFFLLLPALDSAIAMACLWGLPASISTLMLWLMVLELEPLFSGMRYLKLIITLDGEVAHGIILRGG